MRKPYTFFNSFALLVASTFVTFFFTASANAQYGGPNANYYGGHGNGTGITGGDTRFTGMTGGDTRYNGINGGGQQTYQPVVYQQTTVIYRQPPVVYRPAPVVYQPAPVIYEPRPVYCPPPAPVYVYRPAPVIYQRPIYYQPTWEAPVYNTYVPRSQPQFTLGLQFNFGGHRR